MCAYESFPTHARRALGHPPLPGKGRTGTNLSRWTAILRDEFRVAWPRTPSHDEIQAVVAGIAGLQLEAHGPRGCTVCGETPIVENGEWREGFIVSPRKA